MARYKRSTSSRSAKGSKAPAKTMRTRSGVRKRAKAATKATKAVAKRKARRVPMPPAFDWQVG